MAIQNATDLKNHLEKVTRHHLTNCLYFSFSDLAPSNKSMVRKVIPGLLVDHLEIGQHRGYFLDNDDLVVFTEGIDKTGIKKFTDSIEFLFVEDPLFLKDDSKFLTSFNLEADFKDCIMFLTKQISITTKKQAKKENFDELFVRLSQKKDIQEFAKLKTHRQEKVVLLVEDQKFIQDIMRKTIPTSFQVQVASNGREGLELFFRYRPDIVFLDWLMPEVSGYELLQKIKKIDPDCFVVMTTGNTNSDDVRRAIELGVSGYIVKPITRTAVDKYIAMYQQSVR